MLKITNLLIFIFISIFEVFSYYPEVTTSNSDNVYKQLLSDIKENKKRLVNKQEIIKVNYYRYYINEKDTIFTVSARFNLPYDTIATVNEIENQLFFKDKKSIIIPNCIGIFSSKNLFDSDIKTEVDGKNYYLIPGKTFSSSQRLSFLLSPFSSPLRDSIVTSEFGNRENPFTGYTEFHSGLDMKAHEGCSIYSPYKGEINNIGYSDFYGNYLIVSHSNGYTSHYYHLSKTFNVIGDQVDKGDTIALSGNTGKSTGPHLHFEIHHNGEPINPRLLLGEV